MSCGYCGLEAFFILLLSSAEIIIIIFIIVNTDSKNAKSLGRYDLGKTMVMKCEADQQRTCENDGVEFAGKVFVQILLSAVSGFMEGIGSVFCKLPNVAGFWCKKCVDGQLFQKRCGHYGDKD